ncbi:MAG: WD40/YVTN/BNR-like repeat-containing protein [Thermoleophilia bacterium]
MNMNISSLSVSPGFAGDKTVFAGSRGGGVFKSTDGGSNWTAVNVGISYKSVSTVAVSPDFVNDHTVFASAEGPDNAGTAGPDNFLPSAEDTTTADNSVAAPSAGFAQIIKRDFFKSTDAGSSWSGINNVFKDIPVGSISFSPAFASDRTVFVGTAFGVWKSSEGGLSWINTRTNQSPSGLDEPENIYSIAVSPGFAKDRTVFISIQKLKWPDVPGSELSESTDGGSTWSQPKTMSPLNTFTRRLAISPEFATDKTLFAGSVGYWGGNFGTIYKSADGGTSWLLSDDGLAPESNISSIVVSPSFGSDQTVYAGTSNGIFKSTDAGNKWNAANSGIPPNTNVVCMAIAD